MNGLEQFGIFCIVTLSIAAFIAVVVFVLWTISTLQLNAERISVLASSVERQYDRLRDRLRDLEDKLPKESTQ